MRTRKDTHLRESWHSLQNSSGLARPVRTQLDERGVSVFGLSRPLPEPQHLHPPASAPISASVSVDSHANSPISHRSTQPHPEPRAREAPAHALLFSPEEPPLRALVLAAPVPETAEIVASYCDLLLLGAIDISSQTPTPVDAVSGIDLDPKCINFWYQQVSVRAARFCLAALEFTSMALEPNVLSALLKLTSALGSLNAQQAEQLKVKIVDAQAKAQSCLRHILSPEFPNSVETRLSLRLQKYGLTPQLLLEPGFAEELANQLALFHRRCWQQWNPLNDFALVFHTAHNRSAWRQNPLTRDLHDLHFISGLVAQHIFHVGLNDQMRALLIEKWISVGSILKMQGDVVGWAAIVVVLFDLSSLRLSSVWSLVDSQTVARMAHDWGFENFEIHKRLNIPFLSKTTLRTTTDLMGIRYSKRDFVPYFIDLFVYETGDGVGDTELVARQLGRLSSIAKTWPSYVDSLPSNDSEVHENTVKPISSFQQSISQWCRHMPNSGLDLMSLSLAVQPRLLGHYLPSFYQQVLPLSVGAMLPVLFTASVPTFCLFPRNALLMVTLPKPTSKPNTLRRSSSFPPASGDQQTTGVVELDSTARQQLVNTASAHFLAKVIRDLLNVGTETLETRAGIIFKAFEQDERDIRSSRTSSIIENISRRQEGSLVAVKSASLVRLVDVLVLGAGVVVSHYRLDTKLHTETLLSTYRSFCSPAELLDMLRLRVKASRHAGSILEETRLPLSATQLDRLWQVDDAAEVTGWSARILSGITTVLKHWVKNYFFDFSDDAFVLQAGTNLLTSLAVEAKMHSDQLVDQISSLNGMFLRLQYNVGGSSSTVPTWYNIKVKSDAQILELPATTLEKDNGLREINELVDEMDLVVADAFSRISLVDWMKLFEVLEQQASTRTGLFQYANSISTNEHEIRIQTAYSWLSTITNNGNRVLDVLPKPISCLIELHHRFVAYFGSQIADPSLAHPHERRERMVMLLKMLGVLRTRMQFLNLSSEASDSLPKGQHIPSFLESVLVSAILLPESRSFSNSWLAAGTEVSKTFPAVDVIPDGQPNANTIYIPFVPLQSGKPVTVCPGWIVERLLEIVCCVPNISLENPSLVNFDKRRYAYNLVKNMSRELQSPTPVPTPEHVLSKFRFLFNYWPPVDLKGKLHKDAISRDGKSKVKLFSHTVNQEINKVKAEAKQLERLTRETPSHQHSTTPQITVQGSQSFYGLPASQSSTSLYQKRASRLLPSSSTSDVNSFLDQSVPKKSAAPKKSRLGGFLKAVRPLSVLGGYSHGSQTNPSPQSPTGSMYRHHAGSNQSINDEISSQNTSAGSAVSAQPMWVDDTQIDLETLPAFSNVEDEWPLLYNIDYLSLNGIEIRQNFLMLSHKLNKDVETVALRTSSPEEALEWSREIASSRHQSQLNSTKVFGIPLEVLSERTRTYIPQFLVVMLGEIEDRGLTEVGIYRIPGSVGTVNQMRNWFDAGHQEFKKGDPKWADINAVAGCVKLYLRELPESLMTSQLLPDFFNALRDAPSTDSLRATLQRLPEPNYSVLKRLIYHLKLIVDNSDVNRMNVHNVSIVFGVNFLPPVEMKQMGIMQALVRVLVEEYDNLFENYA